MPELVDDLGSAGRKLTPSPTRTVRLKPISTSVHIRARMISDAATPIRTRRIVLIIILPKQISIPKLLRLRSLVARSDEAMACDPAEPTLPVVLLASGTSDPAWHSHTMVPRSTFYLCMCRCLHLMTINCRNRNKTRPAGASFVFRLADGLLASQHEKQHTVD